jgi:hypothetical protein
MRVSHECPLALLSESRTFNDYDYALVHLFEKHLDYYNFFLESLKQGREVILDNSIFELGEAFDFDKYADWILKLKPTYYIIPDVLEDYKRTKGNLHKWLYKYSTLPGKKIAVVQGKHLSELTDYTYYLDNHSAVDVIAISFDYSFYEKSCKNVNKLFSWMEGRRRLIDHLILKGAIKNKPVHLLGCSVPQEFMWYSNKEVYGCIKSVDTSNPIVHGLYNIKYGDRGLEIKKSTKLCDLISSEIDNGQRECIDYNILKFKEFCNGKIN